MAKPRAHIRGFHWRSNLIRMMSPDRPAADVHAYPTDITFHDLIRRNKRNSVLLLLGMGVLTIAVIEATVLGVMAYSGETPDLTVSIIAGLIAFGITFMAGTWSYFGGAKTILSISGAREISHTDDPELFNVVEEMAIAAGLPMPRVYMIDSDALNAFATGRDPAHAAVAITRGLRRRLTRDELTGVMAHEIAHIRHYDIRLTMLIATMVGLIVMASDVMLRSMRYGGGRRGGGGKDKGGAAVLIFLVIAVLLWLIAPLLARLIQFAVSRQREYLADAGAVELTRYPQGLRDALMKLAGDHTPLETANHATAHLFINNPYQAAKGKENLDSPFATHPPINKRIERLNALLR